MSKNDLRAKHTPGPWSVDDTHAVGRSAEEGIEPALIVISDDEGGIVATVPYTYGDTSELEDASANARLISAAPELLEAAKMLLCDLREALDRLEDEGIDTGDWTINMDEARSAIAKAEASDE